MSPRYQVGFGLTDGEVMERLWSFLRRFSKMTKEMRPSHRVDILTDALLYYGKRSAKNLSMFTYTIRWVCIISEIIIRTFASKAYEKGYKCCCSFAEWAWWNITKQYVYLEQLIIWFCYHKPVATVNEGDISSWLKTEQSSKTSVDPS